MLKEFKEFAMRGNVIDMAVGIIIGAAFGRIVNSLVKDVLMPPLGMLVGRVDFSRLAVTLRDKTADAEAVQINYGLFVNSVIDFLIVALAVFFLVRQMNRWSSKKEADTAKPTTRDCPFCFSTIPRQATRCPQCTSPVEPVAE